jgi:hypothetical protein
MSDEDAARLVRTIAETVTEHGPRVMLERYDEWFTADFEWTSRVLGALDGRTHRGKAGFEAYWREFFETFEGVNYEFTAFEALDERRVLVLGHISGAGSSSGVPIDTDAAYVFEFAGDGRVEKGQSFFTREEAEEYLNA